MAMPYKHLPLQGARSFRVLKVLSAPKGAQIEVELLERSVDEPGSYEALSYSWDNQPLEHPVMCNGQMLYVTYNCKAILERFRSTTLPRILWIDAICIDQTSDEERSQQVQLMGEIYEKARQVDVWLCEGTKNTDLAFKYVIRYSLLRVIPGKIGAALQKKYRDRLKREGVALDALREVLHCTWTTRMWTLQEVALARECFVYCGTKHLEWELFRDPFKELIEKLSAPSTVFYDYGTESHILLLMLHQSLRRMVTEKRHGSTTNPEDVFNVLLQTQIAKATNPKDKIYALYGILSQLGIDFPKPDYQLSTADIYRQATFVVINREHSLRILRLIDGSQRIPGLVSWVPDYTDISRPFQMNFVEHSASKKSKARFRFSDDERKLYISGIVVDKIRCCSLLHSYRTDPSISSSNAQFVDAIHAYQDWTSTARKLATYPTGESLQEVIISTILQEHFPLGIGVKQVDDWYLERNDKWTKILMANDPNSGIGMNALDSIIEEGPSDFGDDKRKGKESTPTPTQSVKDILSKKLNQESQYPDEAKIFKALVVSRSPIWLPALHRSQDGTFFLTEAGYMGIGTMSLQAGDQIALVSGMKTPVLLRQEGDCHRLIGNTYVHGMMRGELWPRDDNNLTDYILV